MNIVGMNEEKICEVLFPAKSFKVTWVTWGNLGEMDSSGHRKTSVNSSTLRRFELDSAVHCLHEYPRFFVL